MASKASRSELSSTSTTENNMQAMASDTKQQIDWQRILRDNMMKWKWRENARAFSIYTTRDPVNGLSVLAIGVVKGSLQEVESLLLTRTQEEYKWLTHGIYEKEFKHGQIMSDVVVQDDHQTPGGDLTTLSQRCMTFASSGWLKADCKWNYVEATTSNTTAQTFEQQLTTCNGNVAKTSRRFREAAQLHDVICSLRVQPCAETEDNSHESTPIIDGSQASTPKARPQSTRVHFYGQFVSPLTGHSPPSSSEIKLAEQRLVHLAKSCGRLSVVIRRKRLGYQVLIDPRRVSPSKKPVCFTCGQRQTSSSKLCQLCGQHACNDCAVKHERERRHGPRKAVVDFVRVCDPCLARVESADYSHAFRKAPRRPVIQPNPPEAPATGSDLKDLLRDALLDASSARKPSVMKVIRYVLDQEQPDSPLQPQPRKKSVALTPQSADAEYVAALDDLEVNNVVSPQLAEAEGRTYTMAPVKDPTVLMPYPVPANEERRQQAIEASGVLTGGVVPELNIICDMAAKELNTPVSIVTIAVGNEQVVVGSNRPEYENVRRAREDSFCQHTVMGSQPLIVPHPEADIRFSKISTVTHTGVRFYAGFPLKAVDEKEDVVLGTLCCVDMSTRELTESQFAAMQKLSETAAKVIKIQGRRRRIGTSATAKSYPPQEPVQVSRC